MATKVKITNVNASELKCAPGEDLAIFWDDDLKGFGVRVSKTGRAVFFVQYRDRLGKQAKQTLGVVGVVKADKARAEAKTALAQVQLGENPQQAMRDMRQGDRVLDMITAYLVKAEKKLKPRSYAEVKRALETAAKPLHHHKAAVVRRRDVAQLIEKIAETSGPFAANRFRANLSAMWTWSLKEGRVEGDNPVAYTNKAVRETPRDRVLTDGELALIWCCTNTGHDHDRIVRLLMLTAARREEIGALAWDEIGEKTEAGGALWTLPAARAKNGVAHETPLTPLAYKQLPARRKGVPLVFGRLAGSEVGFSGWSKSKARLDATMLATAVTDFTKANGRAPEAGELALTPWRLHDLRRTFSTWSNENEVPPHIVEAVLNHISGSARRGVAGTYNKAVYRAQKEAALLGWEAHIRALASDNEIDTE